MPFEMVHDRLLDPEHLAPFKTLILPNIAALSDAQCAQLRDFVRRGGGLVATYETSLYDESGRARARTSASPTSSASSFVRPASRARCTTPTCGSSTRRRRASPAVGPRGRAAHHPRRLAARGEGHAGPSRTRRSRWIPSYPDLPMEKVYVREPKTDIPQVFLREVGAGRVAYFPWDIDRTFWEVLSIDHFKLMRNAVSWATNEDPPVTVTGPGVLDVTRVAAEGLADRAPREPDEPDADEGTGPRAAAGRRAARAPAPAGGQTPARRPPPRRRHGAGRSANPAGWMEVTVPSILAHEVIAVDL